MSIKKIFLRIGIDFIIILIIIISYETWQHIENNKIEKYAEDIRKVAEIGIDGTESITIKFVETSVSNIILDRKKNNEEFSAIMAGIRNALERTPSFYFKDNADNPHLQCSLDYKILLNDINGNSIREFEVHSRITLFDTKSRADYTFYMGMMISEWIEKLAEK